MEHRGDDVHQSGSLPVKTFDNFFAERKHLQVSDYIIKFVRFSEDELI